MSAFNHSLAQIKAFKMFKLLDILQINNKMFKLQDILQINNIKLGGE